MLNQKNGRNVTLFLPGDFCHSSVLRGKSGQMGTQESNTLVNLDVILGLKLLLCPISTLCRI